jgi:regulatory protein
MRDALSSAGFDFDTIDRTLARLRQLRLVDDAEFARRWVAERANKRGRVALLAELEAKGIGPDLAEAVVQPIEEEGRAKALAARHLARVGDLPLSRQAARIQGMLLRRGFDEETAEAATRAVLPPEGWD